MLISLAIRNVVLIDKLDLNFENGLNIFTGETGAGKSILLDSLSLVLGARADSGLVRHGQNQLSVTAVFQPQKTSDVYRLLSEHDICCDDADEIILKRIVTQDGKSKAYINDEPVSVSFLKAIGDILVEIHGQFASHQLLNPSTHIMVLDLYAQTEKEKETVKHHWFMYKKTLDELHLAQENLENAQKQEAYLRAGIEDLEKLNPQINEEDGLVIRRNQLMNSEKIITAVKNSGATVVGPIPLPTEKQVYTILRAVHKYKDAREQFEIRTHKRLIDIVNPTKQTIDSLTHMDLPSGVNIEIKL